MPTGIYKRKYDFITKAFLVREYTINRKTKQQVANIVGCSIEAIRNRLIKYNIPFRARTEAMLGRKFTPEWKRNLSEAKKGNKGGYIDGGTIIQHYCKEPSCHNKICYYNWKRGNGRCRPCAYKKLWGDKEFMKKIIRASFEGKKVSPNKPEKQLNKLLGRILPKEYKINVKGNIIIERLIPDFINCNGQKKIIELYGDYWHNLPQDKKRDKRRIKTYKKYGYKTLIIWQHELKNLDKVKEKILTFNKMQKGR